MPDPVVIKTNYLLSAFDKNYAKAGGLCMIVPETQGEQSQMSDKADNCRGVGVCTYASYIFKITAKGILYEFKDDGSTYDYKIFATGTDGTIIYYKLMKAERMDKALSESGVAAPTKYITEVTKDSEGVVTSDVQEAGVGYKAIINGLNARDQFALHVLNGLLNRVPQDPTTMSESVMFNYCKVAYSWASCMMSVSADYRGTYEDDSEISVDPAELDNDTDRLLYNIEGEIENLTTAVINGFQSIANGEE